MSLSPTGGPGGAQPPSTLQDERKGVGRQFQHKMFTLQLAIDHQSTGRTTRQTRKPARKKRNFTQIDKNA